MKILNPKQHQPDVVLVNALKVYMVNKTEADFNELRSDLPFFATLADGEIDQVRQDAGFDIGE